MTRSGTLAAFLVLCLAAPLTAQEVSERRVRTAVEDAAHGLGQAVGGGSFPFGPAATTGGLGHLHLGASVAVTRVDTEDPRTDTGDLEFLLPVGTLHGALGITETVDLVGALGPLVAREDYRDNRMLYALGARVGLLREGSVAPAISATLSREWVDRLEYGDPRADEISFEADVHVTSLRLEASKEFLLFTPYAGVGVHRAGIEARYRIPASRSTGDREITGSLDGSRTHSMTYGGVEFALALLTAVVEVGVFDRGAFGAFGIRTGL